MLKINIEKARDITHDKRRKKRAEEFAPYDEIIMKQIPGEDIKKAEAKRQEIRDKYSDIQNSINKCNNVDDLKKIIKDEELDLNQ